MRGRERKKEKVIAKAGRGVMLMSVAEVAAWLRTSNKAIYTMVERAQLPGVIRVGRRILFDERVLLEWLDEKRA